MIRPLALILCAFVVATGARAAGADPLASELIFSRPTVRSPSLSPDGSLLAVVADTGHDQNALVVFRIDGTTLKPVLKTAVPGLIDVTSYHWISNDILLMWIDIGAGDGSVWAMLNIKKGLLVQMKHKFARLLQDHWGDADHVLIWELCDVSHICVYNWNISIDNGLVYANALPTTQGPRLYMQGTNRLVAELHGNDDLVQRLVWDPAAHNWVADGSTVKTAADEPVNGPYAERFEALRSRTPELRAVETSGTHQVIGATIPPPGPAFLPFADALRSPADVLAAAFPTRRLYWTGISDDLQHAIITSQDMGQPPTYLLWSANAGAAEVARSLPNIDAARLGPVRVENDWFDDGTPVAITAPPAGIAVRSVVVIPVLADRAEARARFVDYDPQTQAFAQHGILSVRVQLPHADERALHDQAWRDAVAQRLSRTADHIRQAGLAPAAKTCVGGTFEGAYAALVAAAAKPDQFACVYAINLPFKPEFLAQPIIIQGMRGHTTRVWNMTGSVRRWVAMEGTEGSAGNPVGWSAQLPARVLLVYDMTWESFGQAIKPHSDGFVDAMKKAGKSAQVYAAVTDFDEVPKWNATMNDSVASFIQ